MPYVAPGSTFESTAQLASGLVGTIGVRIIDNTGTTVTARTTAGIIETLAGSGLYAVTLTAPSTAGQYSVFWDQGGALTPSTTASHELVVTSTTPAGALPSGSDLCSLADVRQFLELPAADTSRDSLIQTEITAASKTIMKATEREFAPATADATRTFNVNTNAVINGSVYFDFSPYDLRSIVTFKLHPEASSPTTLVSLTDYALQPTGAPDGVYTYALFANATGWNSDVAGRFGYAQAEIRGAWGFASVPLDVRQACTETVASWLRRDVRAFGVDQYNEPSGLAPEPAQVYSIPPSAWRKLRHYRRNGGF